jgi:DNA-binding transcriptional LysR family regulator
LAAAIASLVVGVGLESAHVRTAMLWHRRLDRHPAHRWLRDVVMSVTKSL